MVMWTVPFVLCKVTGTPDDPQPSDGHLATLPWFTGHTSTIRNGKSPRNKRVTPDNSH